MSMFNVQVEDNWDFDTKLPQLEKNIIHLAGLVGLREATDYSPYDTGKLQGSWSTMEIGNICRLVNTAEYCRYVNDGTRYMSGQHFVEEAISRIEEQSRDIVNQAMAKL